MSRLVSKNVQALRGRTSMRMEPEFWDALEDAAKDQDLTITDIVRSVENEMGEKDRTSAVRVYILNYYRYGNEA